MNPSAEEILESARRILSEPGFQNKPQEDYTCLRLFLEWLFQQPVVQWLFLFCILGILALVLYKIFVRSWGRKKKTMQPPPDTKRIIAISAPSPLLRMQEAHSVLQKGDTLTAIRILHGSTIDYLDSKKLLSKQRWKTNPRYTQECQIDAHWQSLFCRLSQDFDRAVYGQTILSEECLQQHLKNMEEASR
ncbi:MAG: hypothetical protein LLG04_11240 [Parachlamydia sp.]|nr:hypothetical protein [Parachlamydia sp.]